MLDSSANAENPTPSAAEYLLYPEWAETFEAVADAPGTVLVLGGMDVGKSTFTRLLANSLLMRGRGRVAVLDADPGQSEIGPPACLGLAMPDGPTLSLSDVPPHTLAFLGATSPQGHLMDHAAGVRRLADAAREAGAAWLIVDTSGFLHGGAARKLNQTEFDLLAPTHVVALQRNGELGPVVAPMLRREGCHVHTPGIPGVISRKPATFRANRRAMKWAATLSGAKPYAYAFEDVAFINTWMGGGEPLAPHLLKFAAQTLAARAKVFYAETAGAQLGLMTSAPISPDAPELGAVLEQLKAKSVAVTTAPRLKHLLVGLESASGRLLGLGVLTALDFRRRTLEVLTPVRAPAAARILRFGSLCISPEGREVRTLKPGEL